MSGEKHTPRPAEIDNNILYAWGLPLGEIVNERGGYAVEVGKRVRHFTHAQEMLSFAAKRSFHLEERRSALFRAYARGRFASFVHRRGGGYAFDRGRAGTIIFETLHELIRWGIEKTDSGELTNYLEGGVRLKKGENDTIDIWRDEKRLARAERTNDGSLLLVYASTPHSFDRVEKLLTWAHRRFGQEEAVTTHPTTRPPRKSIGVPCRLPSGCGKEIARELGIEEFTPAMYEAIIEIVMDNA